MHLIKKIWKICFDSLLGIFFNINTSYIRSNFFLTCTVGTYCPRFLCISFCTQRSSQCTQGANLSTFLITFSYSPVGGIVSTTINQTLHKSVRPWDQFCHAKQAENKNQWINLQNSFASSQPIWHTYDFFSIVWEKRHTVSCFMREIGYIFALLLIKR